ncbi:arabinogalactan endo-1,4-beta-galactosidase [Dothidotthia symphoricarpi CBS 119687]|uniref:ferroxidase n=1 Tax=Dothidotthia symphoricarpi CBS 119687 TaxID=1392245 RepID=A0A6A6AI77_9PLEO|nr:arabinogalactan endo-1,4-beta-galactosidase [Dothidotthia symphoricarpi CBS 119687]KAF2130788.1 arabinogalactan endo-1,4-beta-galactosidase [Dothidotthia symphoricarpi CBS 119687]
MKSVTRFSSAALRRTVRAPLRAQTPANCVIGRAPATLSFRVNNAAGAIRPFHSSMNMRVGIMPETENPAPKESEEHDHAAVPATITEEEFHERADAYLEELVARLEEQQEKSPDIEVDYSAGVLNIELTTKNQSYVLNKQPPNKQIWLSSPISGPKRFDWALVQEGQDHKEGGGGEDWVYLRDGSSLTDILRKELGVDLSVDDEVPR